MNIEMENVQYFDLEASFRRSIHEEYSGPLFSKTVFLILFQIVFFIVFSILMENNTDINGYFKVGFGKNPVIYKQIAYSTFLIIHLVFHVLLFLGAYETFKTINLGLYKDYQSGQGIKEVITIMEIMQTPTHRIYITNSPVVKTITDETALCIGDELTIYYLEFSGRLLYVEPEIKRKNQEKK